MARKRSRALSGVRGSSARASTRALNSTEDSNPLKNCSGAGTAASSALAGSRGMRSSLNVKRLRSSVPEPLPGSAAAGLGTSGAADHSGTSADRAATASAARAAGSRSTGDPTRAITSAGANHCRPRGGVADRSRRSRRTSHTSVVGRPSAAGTTPSNRTSPSVLPK